MSVSVRKRQQLKNFGYSSQKYYFVTICAKNHKNIFGTIINENDNVKEKYSACGKIANKHLLQIENHFESITIDKYVIMPNHIHIILIIGCDGVSERSRPFPTLSTVVGLYKSGVSREVGSRIWQKSFHDHIIRNEKDYAKIWEYIDNNPLKWSLDRYYRD